MSRTRNDEAAVLARRLRAMQRPAAITAAERAWYAQAISDGDGGVVGYTPNSPEVVSVKGVTRGDSGLGQSAGVVANPLDGNKRSESSRFESGPSPTPICHGPARWMCAALGEHLCGGGA